MFTTNLKKSIKLFLYTICILTYFTSIAQNTNSHQIRLQSGTIQAQPNAKLWLDSMIAKNNNEPVQVIIHFNAPLTASEKKNLQTNGIILMDYLPENSYTTIFTPNKATKEILSSKVYSIITYDANWKIATTVAQKMSIINSNITIMVSFCNVVTDTDIRQFINNMGGTITPYHLEKYHNYKITLPTNKIHSLIQWYGIKYISPVGMVPLDIPGFVSVKGNISRNPASSGGYGLMGDSVTIGIGDNGSGIYHADLVDRIKNFNPVGLEHHGEHINGIAGGASNIDPFSISMTPHVMLLDYLYDMVLSSTQSMYQDYNMTITNNSYEVIAGDCSYTGVYDIYSQFVDTMALQFPHVLHVFASGNDGGMTCSPYTLSYGTIEGGYQPSKNSIIVGSMTDDQNAAPDESRGPLKDGRLKPDLVAVGLGQYSTIDIDQYEWAAGTSMAAPQVASGLAALTQRYKQVNNGMQPRGDVLKAILMNGATDIGNPGPDFAFGFGSLDMYNSLKIIDSNWIFSDTLKNTGDSQTYLINIPNNVPQIKIMLYWHDVPASPNAAQQLVNDLDLSVIDPSFGIHLPLILDHSPSNVLKNAVPGVDHINNTEQVVINNPVAGTYIVKVKGYNIPQGPQQYAVVYETIKSGVRLTYPKGGEQMTNVPLNIDSMRIFWDAIPNGNTYMAKFSTDGGNNWSVISDNIPSDAKFVYYVPYGINSEKCMAKITRNNTDDMDLSATFVINTPPTIIVDSVQCPTYINIHWSPIPNATTYFLLAKKGAYMEIVDSTTDTFYTYKNKPLNEKSYVAVQPAINGKKGYRSVAAIVTANKGICSNPVSQGDLMLEKIISPTNGRQHSNTALGNNHPITVKIRNLYTNNCDSYAIAYQLNAGTWQSSKFYTPILADSDINVSGFALNLSAVGIYKLRVAIKNLTLADPNSLNDTLTTFIQNIPNDSINLDTTFIDGFEAMSIFSINNDTLGISANGHWDYTNKNDSGRLRTFVADNIIISGNRSISLDESLAVKNGSKNEFIGTFNLSGYDTATTEVRMDFDYLWSGIPQSTLGNWVLVRGYDTGNWQGLYPYDLSVYPGFIIHVKSLSVTDGLRMNHNNFTTATQIAFGQNDTSLIAGTNYGNGITIDNFNLYTVANDAQLVSILAPLSINCGLDTLTPLSICVHNGVNYILHNISLYYQLDSGTIITEIIDSIKAKDTIYYTFSNLLKLKPGLNHILNVWLHEAGDTYTGNDSIFNYKFCNSKIINTFPYLENFEAGIGGYFSDGYKDSWQYGTPTSPKIHKAASGTKAWKTNLTGKYNNLERSYLYSPCFDISSLHNPMLSISVALDIENCGNQLCDEAFVQYSIDGLTWIKLGNAGLGTNWYDSTFDVWNTQGFTRWHVASILLPKLTAGQTIHFRFAMQADPGNNFEGIALDDIHIFDLQNPIAGSTFSTNTNTITANQWTDITNSNEILCSLKPNNVITESLTCNLYNKNPMYNPTQTQYLFSRNYAFPTSITSLDSIALRLYLLEKEFINVLNDTNCKSCTQPVDAYSLGITQFDSKYWASFNNTFADDTAGIFNYYNYHNITWVPYDAGYYADFKAQHLSEFWMNDGGPTGNFPAGIDYVNFIAFWNGQNAKTNWYSLIDTAVNTYYLQRSMDSIIFSTIDTIEALHAQPAGQYSFLDTLITSASTNVYYRLYWTMKNSSQQYFSPIRTINLTCSFSAQQINHQEVLLQWQSYIDGLVNNYILKRAVDDGSYTQIGNINSFNHFGENYFFIDQPANELTLKKNALLHYQLIAYLYDATSISLPIQSVDWTNNNSLISINPNPTENGTFTINWHADTGTVLTLNITDITGKVHFSTTATATQWDNTTTFITFSHPKGLYFVRVNIGGVSYVEKMVWE